MSSLSGVDLGLKFKLKYEIYPKISHLIDRINHILAIMNVSKDYLTIRELESLNDELNYLLETIEGYEE